MLPKPDGPLSVVVPVRLNAAAAQTTYVGVASHNFTNVFSTKIYFSSISQKFSPTKHAAIWYLN